MIKREEIIEIGTYNKPHGINGEISATFDYDIKMVNDLSCLVSEINGIFVPFFIEGKRPKNNQTLLLKIDGLQNEADVKILVNHSIYGLKNEFEGSDEDLATADELPIDYFVGFTVIDVGNGILGKITNVDDSTDNYLFIVDYKGAGVYLPAVDDFIQSIDFEKKTISMNLPDGILQLD